MDLAKVELRWIQERDVAEVTMIAFAKSMAFLSVAID
jgi:hypothetical protein